jgi:hypothetical protein
LFSTTQARRDPADLTPQTAHSARAHWPAAAYRFSNSDNTLKTTAFRSIGF